MPRDSLGHNMLQRTLLAVLVWARGCAIMGARIEDAKISAVKDASGELLELLTHYEGLADKFQDLVGAFDTYVQHLPASPGSDTEATHIYDKLNLFFQSIPRARTDTSEQLGLLRDALPRHSANYQRWKDALVENEGGLYDRLASMGYVEQLQSYSFRIQEASAALAKSSERLDPLYERSSAVLKTAAPHMTAWQLYALVGIAHGVQTKLASILNRRQALQDFLKEATSRARELTSKPHSAHTGVQNEDVGLEESLRQQSHDIVFNYLESLSQLRAGVRYIEKGLSSLAADTTLSIDQRRHRDALGLIVRNLNADIPKLEEYDSEFEAAARNIRLMLDTWRRGGPTLQQGDGAIVTADPASRDNVSGGRGGTAASGRQKLQKLMLFAAGQPPLPQSAPLPLRTPSESQVRDRTHHRHDFYERSARLHLVVIRAGYVLIVLVLLFLAVRYIRRKRKQSARFYPICEGVKVIGVEL